MVEVIFVNNFMHVVVVVARICQQHVALLIDFGITRKFGNNIFQRAIDVHFYFMYISNETRKLWSREKKCNIVYDVP